MGRPGLSNLWIRIIFSRSKILSPKLFLVGLVFDYHHQGRQYSELTRKHFWSETVDSRETIFSKPPGGLLRVCGSMSGSGKRPDPVKIPEEQADECRRRGPDQQARRQVVRNASWSRDYPTRAQLWFQHDNFLKGLFQSVKPFSCYVSHHVGPMSGRHRVHVGPTR